MAESRWSCPRPEPVRALAKVERQKERRRDLSGSGGAANAARVATASTQASGLRQVEQIGFRLRCRTTQPTAVIGRRIEGALLSIDGGDRGGRLAIGAQVKSVGADQGLNGQRQHCPVTRQQRDQRDKIALVHMLIRDRAVLEVRANHLGMKADPQPVLTVDGEEAPKVEPVRRILNGKPAFESLEISATDLGTDLSDVTSSSICGTENKCFLAALGRRPT